MRAPVSVGVLALALALASSTAVAEAKAFAGAMPSARMRSRPRRPAAPGPSAKLRIAGVDPGELPVGAIPPPFEDKGAPKSLDATRVVDDLTLVPSDPSDLPRWKRRHLPMPVRLETRAPGLTAVYLARGELASPAAAVSVGSCGPGLPTRAIRRETFRVDDQGAASFEIDDGWFDPGACAVSVERRTIVHPKVLWSEAGLPVVLGLRVERGILLLFPSQQEIAVDASTPAPPTPVRGSVTRVTLPLAPGVSASLLATVHAPSLAGAVAKATGAPAATAAGRTAAIVVRIDAAQTVEDDEPSVTVRSLAERPEEAQAKQSS